MNYFDETIAFELHDFIIKMSGGKMGVKDEAQVSTTLQFIKNDEYYATFVDKISYLIYSIAKNHAFTDGNKRTSIVLGGMLLMLNGYDHLIPRYFEFMESLVLALVADRITREKFKSIIKNFINLEALSEEDLFTIYREAK